MERQCHAVRRLHRELGGDTEAIIVEIARGLATGQIRRISNTRNWSDPTYARALYQHYVRKGLL